MRDRVHVGDRGHFATSHTSEREWVEAATPHSGGEAADRRGNAAAWRFGGTRGASARREPEPGLRLAATRSARTVGAQGVQPAESAAGSRNERDGDRAIGRCNDTDPFRDLQ
jgi:hypothetical protein